MKESKEMSALAVRAVEKVIEAVDEKTGQKIFDGKWGVQDHMAAVRYLTEEALAESAKKLNIEPVLAGKLLEAVKEQIKAEFAQCSGWAYASNMQKVLVECGYLEAGATAPRKRYN